MAKVVIIGIPGESGLWIADIDAGTVTPLEAPAEGPLAAANRLRAGGTVVTKGVDLAVAISSAAKVSSGLLDP
ncbi:MULTISPECIES: hypothetical protein [unclassified Rhizobium]|uniref:hypothetical protein n=1 Tax=unclassified Rhizobium TaxID=2613769 RepID=UPI0009EC401A|nr:MULTISPECIES: hypothetical protein [unclassified Rhizobium]